MKRSSVVKGLLAGLIGGLAGTFAKNVVERIYPPRSARKEDPTEVLVDKVSGSTLTNHQEETAAEAIHWGFGAAAGAAYGGLVEYYPAASARNGAAFGIALMGLTHESSLPALGLSAAPEELSAHEQSSEAVSHVVYGVATETVRSLVRKLL